jgi:hypothetical protein
MPIRKKVVRVKKRKVKKVSNSKKIVNEFSKNYSKSIDGIKKMSIDLYSFLSPSNSNKEHANAYNNYSVERILRERRIPVLFRVGKDFKFKPKWGCYTLSRIMFACLKEMGLKPKLVRYFVNGGGPLVAQKKVVVEKRLPHTSVFFSIKWKIV